jgi:hypothetical protein
MKDRSYRAKVTRIKEQERSKSKSRHHWAIPTLMTSSFFAAIVFAIAHHLYYAKLNNTLVGPTTKQQWPIRFGTAFAFLVKASLTTATGTAYIQWVWRICRQQPVTIGAVDSAFAVDRNPFLLLNWGFISDFQLPVLLAAILWCIPLSALITPATLSVASQPRSTIHSIPVNQPTFFWNFMFYLAVPAGGPSASLRKYFSNLITTGEVLPPPTPQGLQNISYSLDLTVPIVRCLPSSDAVIAWTAAAAVEAAMDYRKANYWDTTNGDSFGYSTVVTNARNLSWTINNTLSGQIGYFGTYGNTTTTNSSLYDFWIAIADLPLSMNISYFTCSIWNASIPTNITFINNVLNLQTGSTRILDIAESTDSKYYWLLQVYDSFGRAYFEFLADCIANFQLSPDTWGASKNGTLDTTVFGTASDYFEVSFVWDNVSVYPPQGIVPQSKNLATLIEDVALNASLSLMSNSFASNLTMADVTETLWQNHYTYHPKNLLIAYGYAILACLITVLAGAYAIYLNGESDDTYFSSIGNTIQDAQIATLFKLHGKPLGRDILKRRIQLRKRGEIERFCLDIDLLGEELGNNNKNKNREGERAEEQMLTEHKEVAECSNRDLEIRPISSNEN